MPDPTAADALRFLATASREVLKLAQADDFNTAVRLLDALVKDDEARKAIAADKAKEAAQ